MCNKIASMNKESMENTIFCYALGKWVEHVSSWKILISQEELLGFPSIFSESEGLYFTVE